MIVEILKAAEAEYPASWFEPAIKLAVTHNARKWSYVETILKRWQVEGFMTKSQKQEGIYQELKEL